MATLVQVSELSLFHENSEPILRDLSFSVEEGKIAILNGLNRTAQAALLKILIGELRPDRGQILMVGRNIVRIDQKTALQMRRKEIGVIPRNFRPPNRTVRDALQFKMNCLGTPYETGTKIEEALEDTDLETQAETPAGELLILDQIRLSLALAIVNRPSLVICDDLFNSVSDEVQRGVISLLKNLVQRREITFLLISKQAVDDEEPFTTINLENGSERIDI